ncbi:hypothetical protein GTA08_BOTSDO00673 [Botryosphaeria dothidea]|uniref:MARVEL domain-containing protein n=1 Tax=Botryosphaeria dothidea TaxID=55169 RepID=A0A8H4N770_9PEZI|nr:hypothetical protein GTA08_BOTSDO00673 [Botryosphaeria dothidea]
MTGHSTQMVTVPCWFTILRVFQLVLALVIIIISAFRLHYRMNAAYFYSVVVACATIMTSTYHLIATFTFQKAYNAWIILFLDVILVFIWLIALGLTGDLARSWTRDDPCHGSGDNYYCSRSNRRNTAIAVACLCANEFLLFLITLIIFSIRLHRQRKADQPSSSATPPPNYAEHAQRSPYRGDGNPYAPPTTNAAIPFEKITPPAHFSQPITQSYQQPAAQQQHQPPQPSPYNQTSPASTQATPATQSPLPSPGYPPLRNFSSPISSLHHRPQPSPSLFSAPSPLMTPQQSAVSPPRSVVSPLSISSDSNSSLVSGSRTTGGDWRHGRRYYQKPSVADDEGSS